MEIITLDRHHSCPQQIALHWQQHLDQPPHHPSRLCNSSYSIEVTGRSPAGGTVSRKPPTACSFEWEPSHLVTLFPGQCLGEWVRGCIKTLALSSLPKVGQSFVGPTLHFGSFLYPDLLPPPFTVSISNKHLTPQIVSLPCSTLSLPVPSPTHTLHLHIVSFLKLFIWLCHYSEKKPSGNRSSLSE